MDRWSVEGSTLTDIADAIREKTGGSEEIKVEDMAGKIGEISGGGSGGGAAETCTVTFKMGFYYPEVYAVEFCYTKNGVLVSETRESSVGSMYGESLEVDKNTMVCVTGVYFESPTVDYGSIIGGTLLTASMTAIVFIAESSAVAVNFY